MKKQKIKTKLTASLRPLETSGGNPSDNLS